MGQQIQSEKITIKAGKQEPVYTDFNFFRIKSITGATSVQVALGPNGGLFEEMEPGRKTKLSTPENVITFKNTAAVDITIVYLALLGSEDADGNLTLASGAVVKIDDATPVKVRDQYVYDSVGVYVTASIITTHTSGPVTLRRRVITNMGPEAVELISQSGSSIYKILAPFESYELWGAAYLRARSRGTLPTTLNVIAYT